KRLTSQKPILPIRRRRAGNSRRRRGRQNSQSATANRLPNTTSKVRNPPSTEDCYGQIISGDEPTDAETRVSPALVIARNSATAGRTVGFGPLLLFGRLAQNPKTPCGGGGLGGTPSQVWLFGHRGAAKGAIPMDALLDPKFILGSIGLQPLSSPPNALAMNPF